MQASSTDTDKKIELLLLLQAIPNLGCTRIHHLIKSLGNIENILSCNRDDLCKLGLNSQQIHAIIKPEWQSVNKQFEIANKYNIEIISIYDQYYPPLLKEIYDPPLVLYLQGNKKILSALQIGIVGTRKPTLYGKQMAEYFSKELAEYGYVITSGFALGIDITAHLTAVQTSFPTIAVLGTSLDYVYPNQNKKYITKILEAGGAIISENCFTTFPHPSCFPRRNRIISGLSQGVLVIEAARKSGSLITARCALEQSKEVFAVPGNITNTQALGCLDLISQGAKLVTRVEDIVEELAGFKLSNPSLRPQRNLNLSLLDPVQEQLLSAVAGGVVDFDYIAANSHLSPDLIAAQLIQLEIMGYIATVPGGYAKN
ncbi:MAG: DNA-processing protein DprA [Gammaproteobacteria bacterium]|nr:DNA-processing protein DprA [Gammaproteobacteria bacterium]